jgi:2-deoxy-D-gluconate 3-dehydrogenase
VKLFDLSGRVAVVTGGNGGLGLGMAMGLAEAGASIVVVGRNTAKNSHAVELLKSSGADACAIAADLVDESSCRRMIDEAGHLKGRIDILFNNAGISIRKAPQDYTSDEWHAVLNTNLTTAFVCSQAAYPYFKKAGQGKIINVGSMTSKFGLPFAVPYTASKGGIMQLSRGLATAWAADNIQVNTILPGWIDTDMTRNARRLSPALHDRVLMRTPAARWGTPSDLAGIAVFLASSASDFVTGAAIAVDGGYSAQG